MFTAKLIKKVENEKRLKYLVEYSNGTDAVEETHITSRTKGAEAILKQQVKQHLEFLNESVESIAEGDFIEFSVDTEDVKKEAWGNEVLHLEYLLHLVEIGVLASNAKEVTDQRALVIDKLRTRYLKNK